MTHLFQKLRTMAEQQSSDGELPCWLLTDIVEIAGAPELYAGKTHLIEQLIEQIGNFDPYAGVGCFDTSASAEMIQATIRQIRSE